MSLSHRPQARSRLMKERDYHDELKNELESGGLNVNIRPSTVLEYPADVPGSRLSGFLAIACPCTWRWAAVRDAFDFRKDHFVKVRSSQHGPEARVTGMVLRALALILGVIVTGSIARADEPYYGNTQQSALRYRRYRSATGSLLRHHSRVLAEFAEPV